MSELHALVSRLAKDRRALEAFLRDPESWVGEQEAALSETEAAELHRISVDLDRLCEMACTAELDVSPESRFGQRSGLDRRRLMINVGSATLAGLAGLFLTRFSSAAQAVEGQRDSLMATDTTACDNGCTNNFTCNDDDGCRDVECQNNGTCNDLDNCTDSRCTNTNDCADTLCSDLVQCTNDTCTDSYCMDVTDPNKCSNSTCIDHDSCVDSGCVNSTLCTDNDGCIDQAGQCSDTKMCADNCG